MKAFLSRIYFESIELVFCLLINIFILAVAFAALGFNDPHSPIFFHHDTICVEQPLMLERVNIYNGKILLSCIAIFIHPFNVDHQFQKAGFDKKRLFYTQGDYGLWQCLKPCHQKTYDNEDAVRRMILEQKDMKIPTELIPKCPVCGASMTMNLHCDGTFVQDEGWYAASGRYDDFIRRHKETLILFLELGVGGNTPGVIKYPFWQMTRANPKAVYACVNYGEAYVTEEIAKRPICISADIGEILKTIIGQQI